MSMRFWAGSGAMLAGAVILGLMVGGYATSQPPRDVRDPIADIGTEQGETPSSFTGTGAPDSDRGPGIVRCRGCGPTLAERRMAIDNAGLDPDSLIAGTSDPLVADYLARDERPAPPADVSTPDLHRLPVNVQRFADGVPGPPLAPSAPPPAVARTTDTAPPR